jgi:hypothetical protein
MCFCLTFYFHIEMGDRRGKNIQHLCAEEDSICGKAV